MRVIALRHFVPCASLIVRKDPHVVDPQVSNIMRETASFIPFVFISSFLCEFQKMVIHVLCGKM